jgi:hypothetical protein
MVEVEFSPMRPPISRRVFLGDTDRIHYLYGKALFWFTQPKPILTARARVFSQQIPEILNRIAAPRSCFAAEASALVAEIDDDWASAVLHRSRVIGLIIEIRELAETEAPIARRAILRDFAPAKLADAYDLLAISQCRRGQLKAAESTLRQSRSLCAQARIAHEGSRLLNLLEDVDDPQTS